MNSVTKKIMFCAGHRIMNHEGKCRNIHGHNYIVEIVASSDKFNELDMIVDFSIIKEKLGNWIDKNWDHAFIFNKQDKSMEWIFERIPEMKIFKLDRNPTAEIMAEYLLKDICPKVFQGTNIIISKIVVWETDSCCGECSLTY